jgi:hypothetical protein
MTKPKASREVRGKRVYPIPNPVDGEIVKLPSVSSLDGVIWSYPLENWKLTTVASEMAKRKDLVILAATDPKDAARQALNAAQRSANVGSSVHALSEQAEEGTLDMDLLSNDARAWVESYLMAKEAYGWRVVLQEETIYNFELNYGGTLDRVLEIPGEGVVVVDLKTGKGVYGSSASQLSLYANGEGVWSPPASCPQAAAARRKFEEDVRTGENVPEGRRKWSEAAQDEENAKLDALYWEEYARLGKHTPMPEGLRKDKAFLLHVYGPDEHGKPRMAELFPLRLDPELPRALSVLFQWSNDRSILGEMLPPRQPEKKQSPKAPIEDSGLMTKVIEAHTQDLLARARALPKQLGASLRANWPQGVPSLVTGGHTEDQLDLIEILIGEQEALALVADNFPGAKVE